MSVVGNIITKTPRIIVKLIIFLIALAIKAVTHEPGKDGALTARKYKRVRALTKFKRFLLNLTPDPVCAYLGLLKHKQYLNRHFSYGV